MKVASYDSSVYLDDHFVSTYKRRYYLSIRRVTKIIIIIVVLTVLTYLKKLFFWSNFEKKNCHYLKPKRL